jgi:hypothetical protein
MRESRQFKVSLQQQAQRAGAQGQEVAAARNHYFTLYTDLVQLAQKDAEASAIVRRYGIQFNQPPSTPATPQAGAAGNTAVQPPSGKP